MNSRDLETIIRSPVLHRLRAPIPEGPIGRDYILDNTVIPCAEYRRNGFSYRVSISPPKKGLLAVTLREFDSVEKINSATLRADVPQPARYTTEWVNTVAGSILSAAKSTGIALQHFPPYDVLRGMIASRIEFYLRGGSAQRMDN